eukprot:52821-Eustigmatos_ZCMA.PRE.1
MRGQLSGSPVMDVPDDDKDVDVLKEEQRVKNSHDGQDVVVLKGLHKIYPGGKAAVQALSLGEPKRVLVHVSLAGIPKAECFGLLGVNGAGKVCCARSKLLSVPISPSHVSAAVTADHNS